MTLPENALACRRPVRFAVLAAILAAVAALLVTARPAQANPPMPHDPVGALQQVTSANGSLMRLQGWAADPDTTGNVTVIALLDGRRHGSATTAVPRPSIQKHHATGPTPGFDFSVSVPSGVHVLCVAVRNVGQGLTRVLGCRVVPLGTQLSSSEIAAHSPTGALTSVQATSSTFEISGWAAEPDFRNGRIVAVLYLDGYSAKTVNTTRATSAQRAAGAGKRGAFDITVPASKGAHIGCVWLVNTGLGSNTSLGCQAADTRGAAGTGTVTEPKTNKAVVTEARKHLGQPYVWGAEGPKKFDCSGLVMYSYGKAGYTTPRIAQDQFAAARVIPASRAVPGDLVFYHDAEGAVYHVGIYLKPGKTIAAIDEQEGVNYQTIWDASSATYGSFTHT